MFGPAVCRRLERRALRASEHSECGRADVAEAQSAANAAPEGLAKPAAYALPAGERIDKIDWHGIEIVPVVKDFLCSAYPRPVSPSSPASRMPMSRPESHTRSAQRAGSSSRRGANEHHGCR